MNISQANLGVIYISLCIFLWSLLGIFVKFAQSNLDHYQYMFYSSIVSFLSLLILAIFNKSATKVFSYSKKILLVLFALGFLDFIFYLLLYYGYHNGNSLEVLVIQYTWPIFIVVLSLIILKEDFTKRKLFAVILGFIGVGLVITKGDFKFIKISDVKAVYGISIINGIFGQWIFSSFTEESKKVNLFMVMIKTLVRCLPFISQEDKEKIIEELSGKEGKEVEHLNK